MDAALMSLGPHERGIHVVYGTARQDDRAAGQDAEAPDIDQMQDAFYSRAKADEPRRCTGCRHAAGPAA